MLFSTPNVFFFVKWVLFLLKMCFFSLERNFLKCFFCQSQLRSLLFTLSYCEHKNDGAKNWVLVISMLPFILSEDKHQWEFSKFTFTWLILLTAEDGQHIYQHSINVRCMLKEYGSWEACPDTITASIVELEGISMTEVGIT